jgi:hypothetical protein
MACYTTVTREDAFTLRFFACTWRLHRRCESNSVAIQVLTRELNVAESTFETTS